MKRAAFALGALVLLTFGSVAAFAADDSRNEADGPSDVFVTSVTLEDLVARSDASDSPSEIAPEVQIHYMPPTYEEITNPEFSRVADNSVSLKDLVKEINRIIDSRAHIAAQHKAGLIHDQEYKLLDTQYFENLVGLSLQYIAAGGNPNKMPGGGLDALRQRKGTPRLFDEMQSHENARNTLLPLVEDKARLNTETNIRIANLALQFLQWDGTKFEQLPGFAQKSVLAVYGRVQEPPPQVSRTEERIYYRRINYADPKRIVTILMHLGLVAPEDLGLYSDVSVTTKFNDSTKRMDYGFTYFSKIDQETISGRNAATSPKNDPTTAFDTQGTVTIGDASTTKLFNTAVPKFIAVRCRSGNPAREWQRINAAINMLDVKPHLIDLEVRIWEVSCDDVEQLGLRAQGMRGGIINSAGVFELALTEEEGKPADANQFEPFSLGDYHRSGASMLLSLDALRKEDRVELLARPVLSVLEGSKADYFAGELVPYAQSTVNLATGAVSQATALKNVGVYMSFV
ncbi:MAG: hypothetical protein M3R04_00750, partial [bacterium]|nr:hypothetical protein [bacterium]